MKLSPPITLIGIAGTSGKTSVAYYLNGILKSHFEFQQEKFYFIDPYQGSSPLSLLAKVKRDDIVLLEMSVEILAEFDKAHISPHISVITNIEKDYAGEFAHPDTYLERIMASVKCQTYNNFLIASDETVDYIKAHSVVPIKAKILRTGVQVIPASWELPSKLYHMRENIALAFRVAEILHIGESTVQDAIRHCKPAKGRLEYIKKIRNAEYYNDSASANIHSTLAALKSLGKNKNIVLIFGGSDQNIGAEAMKNFVNMMSQYIHTLILLPGSGTYRIHKYVLDNDAFTHVYAHSVYDAVLAARDRTARGDIVLFSPGFPAKGTFASQTARGEHFVWVLRGMH